MIGRTGLSLNMGARTLGTPAIAPADPRPRCRQCGGKWTGGHLLLCEVCEHDHLDLMADARDEQDWREQRDDRRESDREIVL